MTTTSAPTSPQKVFSAKFLSLPLGAAVTAVAAGVAYFDTTVPGGVTATPGGTATRIGVFAESVDNSAGATGAKSANVQLDTVIEGKFLANDGSVVAATIGANVYYVANGRNDTATTTVGVVAGRCWGVFTPADTQWSPYVAVA
jgi:hypothetical protein